MDPVVKAALESWRPEPWLVMYLLIVAGLYARGWWILHRKLPRRFGLRTIVCYGAGLATVYLALASPLDAFAGLLLQAHMVQHLLLAMVAPPLLLLGAPVAPLLRGLPRSFRRDGVAPLLASPALQRVGRVLTHPAFCGIAFGAAMVSWHVPAMYELALRSPFWHIVEHGCFLGTGVLFWWPVVQPWPSRPRWPRWSIVPYLLVGDLQNTALSALLIFGERVVYPSYARGFRPWGISVFDDQAAAGAFMWVPGSLVYLVPAAWIALDVLGARRGVRPSEVTPVPAIQARRLKASR